jgi:cytochrome c5
LALVLGAIPFPAVAQDVPPGHALYDEYCATCHGDDLTGGNNSSLIDGEWQFGSSRGEIVQSIAEGIPARGMPAFGDVLSDREVGQIADFVQRVAEGEGTVADDAPAAPDSLETLDYELDAEVFAHGLNVPWGIAFIGARGALPSLFTYGHRNPQGLGRVRDVAPGPDGAVYVVLNKPHRVLRLVPRKRES